MSRHLSSSIVSGLRLVLLACALPAAAQSTAVPDQRIEISATRYDVRTLCPAIDVDLPARLARAARVLQEPALVEVQFQIVGQHIDDVATLRGGTFETRAATRRAVRALACDNGHAGRQTVRFEVHFTLDDKQPRRGHAAAPAVNVAQSGQDRAAK
jgi:hypothetical protein